MTVPKLRGLWPACTLSNASGLKNHRSSSSALRIALSLFLGVLLILQQIHYGWRSPLLRPPDSLPSALTLQFRQESSTNGAYLSKDLKVDEAWTLVESEMADSQEAARIQGFGHSKLMENSSETPNPVGRQYSPHVPKGERCTILFPPPDKLKFREVKRRYPHKNGSFTRRCKRGLPKRIANSPGKLVEIGHKDYRASGGTPLTSPTPKIESFASSSSRRVPRTFWMNLRKAILTKHPGLRLEPANTANMDVERKAHNLPSTTAADLEAARKRAKRRWKQAGNKVQAVNTVSSVGRMIEQTVDQVLEKTYHGLEWLEDLVKRCEPVIKALANIEEDLEMQHQYHLAQELIGLEVVGLEAFGI